MLSVIFAGTLFRPRQPDCPTAALVEILRPVRLSRTDPDPLRPPSTLQLSTLAKRSIDQGEICHDGETSRLTEGRKAGVKQATEARRSWGKPDGRRSLRSPYPAELFAGSTRRHCGRPTLAMPTTWMIAPRIITPRNANKLKKPRQQLSGTATASNKNRFMAKYVVYGFAAPPNCSPPRRSDNAVQKICRI
jgi:hypothetical protein